MSMLAAIHIIGAAVTLLIVVGIAGVFCWCVAEAMMNVMEELE